MLPRQFLLQGDEERGGEGAALPLLGGGGRLWERHPPLWRPPHRQGAQWLGDELINLSVHCPVNQ